MGRVAGVRARPAIFRALGRAESPEAVEIGGETFVVSERLKHDSWAATGVYRSATRTVICKFNRQQAILGLPMRWLGRLLAARERGIHARLAGIEGVPAALGAVRAGGRLLPHAVAREFVAGHALAEGEWVDEAFFPRLSALLAEVHRRGVAHVDLHKRENILVDEAGRPHLIDFQISVALPDRGAWAAALRGVLRMLQRCDEYHLLKHAVKHGRAAEGLRMGDVERLRPWWIRVHRTVAVPFRRARRGLLAALRIRTNCGHAHSEAFPEIAHRRTAA